MPPPPPWSATLLPPPAMAARWALLLATPSLLPRANLLWLRAPRFSLVGVLGLCLCFCSESGPSVWIELNEVWGARWAE